MKLLRIAGAVVLLASLALPASAQATKSDNVTEIAKVKYWGGSHLAFGNGYAYAGN